LNAVAETKSKNVFYISLYGSVDPSCRYTRSAELLKILAEKGWSVHIICPSWHHLLSNNEHQTSCCSDGITLKVLRTFRYSHRNFPMRLLHCFLFSIRLRFLQVRGLNGNCSNCDNIVICSIPMLGMVGGSKNLAKRLNAPLILEVRDLWPESLLLTGRSVRHFMYVYFGLLNKHAINASCATISLLERICEVRPILKGKPFLWLPNGLSLKQVEKSNVPAVPPRIMEYIARTRSADTNLVVYAGNLGEFNGVDKLVKFISQEPGSSRFTFIVLGGGSEAYKLKELSKSTNNLLFHPFVGRDVLHEIYRLCDFGIFSLSDFPLFSIGISPNKICDYLENRLPVISLYNSDDKIFSSNYIFTFDMNNWEDSTRKLESYCDMVKSSADPHSCPILSEFRWAKLGENLHNFIKQVPTKSQY